MKITNCRICNNKYFFRLFSLGKMSFTGKFPKNFKDNISKEFINLMMCKSCNLVQLDRNFNPKYLYGKDYGYRTGINSTMTNHVKNIVKTVFYVSFNHVASHMMAIGFHSIFIGTRRREHKNDR